MAEVYNVIRHTKKCFPSATVVVNGIIIRRDVSRSYIADINEGIRWACDSLKAVFVDVNKFVDYSCLARDGLHLNRKGSFLLGKLVNDVVNVCINKGN